MRVDDVDHVEPVGLHAVDSTPNDTYFAYGTSTFPYDQWHYWDQWGIDADQAWNIETGKPSVLVGIIDTGVKYRHTDLGGTDPPGPNDNVTNGNIWVNPNEIPGNGIDDDGDGLVDDVIGYDFLAATPVVAGYTCADNDCGGLDNDPNDGNGHGTHVAGTVAAITNNARAVAGIAGGFSDGTTAGAGNGCKLVPCRIGVTEKKTEHGRRGGDGRGRGGLQLHGHLGGSRLRRGGRELLVGQLEQRWTGCGGDQLCSRTT
jgi:subtilisin family serine protease